MSPLEAFKNARTEWLERSSEQHRTDDCKGEVHFSECCLCGRLVWTRTCKEGSGYCIEPMSADDCPMCKEVFQRSPELANWVLNVVTHALRRADT